MAPSAGRNADWSRDETILLLDLYLRHPEADARHPEVAALSELLRELAGEDGSSQAANFRNPVGIAMKLWNLAQQDPAFRRSGRAGLSHGNRLNAEVWASLAHDQVALRREVQRILQRRPPPHHGRSNWKPSRGPAPSFGPSEADRLDGPTAVYILILEGTERWLGWTTLVPTGHDLLKVGLSNDIERRVEELNAGLPEVLGLRWRRHWAAQLPSGADAFALEQEVLRIAHQRGWSGAGEFVIAPASALEATVRELPLADMGTIDDGP